MRTHKEGYSQTYVLNVVNERLRVLLAARYRDKRLVLPTTRSKVVQEPLSIFNPCSLHGPGQQRDKTEHPVRSVCEGFKYREADPMKDVAQ
jgi:hypothetical protein